jgi:hypothetical protein
VVWRSQKTAIGSIGEEYVVGCVYSGSEMSCGGG